MTGNAKKRKIAAGSREPLTLGTGGDRVHQIQRSGQDRDGVLFSRPEHLKIFISSEMRSRSLEKERFAAAADDWRSTRRRAQIVVDYAQEKGLQHMAWRSLLNATRWYLDRGSSERAGFLAAPAVVLAQQSIEANANLRLDVDPQEEGVSKHEENGDELKGLGQLARALLTLACYVVLSSQDSAHNVWVVIINKVAPNAGQSREVLHGLFAMALEAAVACKSEENLSTL